MSGKILIKSKCFDGFNLVSDELLVIRFGSSLSFKLFVTSIHSSEKLLKSLPKTDL